MLSLPLPVSLLKVPTTLHGSTKMIAVLKSKFFAIGLALPKEQHPKTSALQIDSSNLMNTSYFADVQFTNVLGHSVNVCCQFANTCVSLT